MPSEASLANLKPPWPKGQSAFTTAARGYRAVLALARRASPEAMNLLIACMRDEEAPWNVRANVAMAIIDRAWGKPKEHLSVDADGISTLRIEFVDSRDAPGDAVSAAPTINGETFEVSFAAPDEDAEHE